MTADFVITNARIIGRQDEVAAGSVAVRDGVIADIGTGPSAISGAEDFGGDYLLPGLVELHTDNLEKHFAPRPGVRWPARLAVINHDAQVAAAGITSDRRRRGRRQGDACPEPHPWA